MHPPKCRERAVGCTHFHYAANPIIACALYFAKYIEDVGSGTTDIFEHCAAQGLEPPIFEVDARHVCVTVKRPVFDEHGHKVDQKDTEVGQKNTEVGQKTVEVGRKIDFTVLASVGRKDFCSTCERVWNCLAQDSRMSRHKSSQVLGVAESTVQSATNALQEVGLLRREGTGKGSVWFVMASPGEAITKRCKPITRAP